LNEGVVLLHALARQPGSMEPLARSLRAAGYKTFAPFYPSRRATVVECARGLAGQVRAFAADVSREHFVGHSMGGLVARALAADVRPGRVVTLGAPHGGSEIMDLLGTHPLFRAFYGPVCGELGRAANAVLSEKLGPVDYPLGSIAVTRALNIIASRLILPSPNDGAVSVAATRVDGMADHRTVRCAHFLLPRDAGVMGLCRVFLRAGRFS
jgi:pimeloyl-ACP methyl ester carboxylesterase